MIKNTPTALRMITSGKSLERELVAATKLFQGKETESNWEERMQTLQLLDSFLYHDKFEEWKNIITQGIHNLVFGIADATHSLRTKYALVAFDLIKHIGLVIGTHLDATTFETLFTGLLRCVNSSKQLVANKAKDTMVSFISTTSYHNKAISLLCLALDDRSAQSRHLIALYMKTYLQTHAPNTLVRDNMGYLNTLKKVTLFLKSGLLDAAPAVRETCSSTFWIFHKYWPANGDRLLLSLDTATRKQLEKGKSSMHSLDNKQNTLGKRSIPPTMTTNSTSGQHTLKSTRLPDLSPKRKRHSSKVSISPSPSPTPTHAPALASASLLHMLSSNDTTINCDGLCILAKRLSTHHHQSSLDIFYEMVLPSTVPRRADLIPILWDYLSPDRLRRDETMCNQLMSWDCLSEIFVRVFSLHQFLPGVILAGQRHCRDTVTSKLLSRSLRQPQYHSTCTLGLKRLKLYLKYNNKNLMKDLLDILLMATTYGGAGLRDPNATRELKDSTPNGKKAHDDLVYELVNWMDELVCAHIGLNDDDNEHDVIKQCDQPWIADVLSAATLGVATEWVANNENLELCLESVLRALKSYASATSSVVFTSLITLVGRLRLVNARIYNTVLDQSEEDVILLLDTCLGSQHSVSQRRIQQMQNEDTDQEEDDSDEHGDDDNDPPPPYDDIALSSPPSWSGIQQDDFSLSSLSSQEIGLENTLLDEDDYNILDTSLEDMSPEPFFISINDISEVNDELITTAPVTDLDPPTENISTISDITTDEIDTVTTNSNTENKEISNLATDRKAKKKEDTDLDALVDAIYQLTAAYDNRLLALQTLEHLSEYYSTKDEGTDGPNGQRWMQTGRFDILEYDGSLLGYLINQLTEDLQQIPQQQQITMMMLRLLKQLLIHQGNLLQQDDRTTQDLALAIAKALILVKVEKFGRIPSMVDEVQDIVLATINIRTSMKLVAQLLEQQLTTRTDDLISSTPTYTLRTVTIFNMVAKLAPNLANDLLDEFMVMDGCSNYFAQGINHSTLSIRQSCVNALVELATSGHDIKRYLPNLRKEQVTLLDHYIGLKGRQSGKSNSSLHSLV